jgi:PPK2 family polyphosphate:nucleotide phosphotransferase
MVTSFSEIERLCKVRPGTRVRLSGFDPGWQGHGALREISRGERKEHARAFLEQNIADLAEAQDRLWANDVYSVLLVLQAMDAAGKDGIIKHVMSGVNPQGCQVFSFKRPSDEELDHNFLWRYSRALPERGRIGIFNRSYYEEVLVVRVHPEILARQKLPPGTRNGRFWAERYRDINEFERHLVGNGTRIVKIFLHLSKTEQKKRFLERLGDPEKHWKFSIADLHERKFWSAYQRAFAEMLTHTSTARAPWWVVPSDNKWVSRALVSEILTHEIEALGLKHPMATEEQKRSFAVARKALLAEK